MNMGGGGGDHGHGMGMMMPPPSSRANGTMMHRGGMVMHMTFFWGHRVNILFTGWPGGHRHGVGMYLLALLFVLALSVLVEFLSYLHRLAGRRGGLVLTGIATLRTGLSYLVMLAVMSFNAGVLIAALVGHAVGYYVFFASKACRGTGTGGGHATAC